MNPMRMALRNVRRQPRRSMLTGIAIMITVAVIIFFEAYLGGATESFFETFVRLEAGHVKVMPEKAIGRSRPLPLGDGLRDVDALMERISSVPGVLAATPRIRYGVLMDKPGGSVPAMGVGLIPSRERDFMDLEKSVVEGRVPADDAFEVLLGDQLAGELGLKVGDELFMVASTSYSGLGPGLFTVVGLSHTGIRSLDKKNFYVPLLAAQDQLVMEDMAVEIVCRVEDGMEAAVEMAERIQAAIDDAGYQGVEAVPWQLQGNIYQMMAPARQFSGYALVLLGFIALATVLNTVLMSVMERTREIGTLRALGFGRGTLVRLIVVESMVIGVVGSFAGILLGMAVSIVLNNTGIDFSAAVGDIDWVFYPIIYPKPDIFMGIKAGIFGIIVSLIAAWYPSRVAVRLEPAVALRKHQ